MLSGSIPYKKFKNGLSIKVDWSFNTFNLSNGTIDIDFIVTKSNLTGNHITTYDTFNIYCTFNDQTSFLRGGADEGFWNSSFSETVRHKATFQIPKNGDLSNVSIGVKNTSNVYGEEISSKTFNLPSISNGYIKKTNWKKAMTWIKDKIKWHRCIAWKKINGEWKNNTESYTIVFSSYGNDNSSDNVITPKMIKLSKGYDGDPDCQILKKKLSEINSKYKNITMKIISESPTAKSINNLFSNFLNIINLDLSEFNTSNVEDMRFAFFNCSFLKNLNLQNWNTINVKDMNSMFLFVSRLTTLDLTSFNTINVKDMGIMFNGCTSLNLIKVTQNLWVTQQANTTRMFSDCGTDHVTYV